MLKHLTVLLFLLCCVGARAQSGDSLARQRDTVAPGAPRVAPPLRRVVAAVVADTVSVQDSVFLPFRTDTLVQVQSLAWQHRDSGWLTHPYYRFVNPVRNPVSVRQWQGREPVFYSLVALLLFFALIRNGFARYIGDLTKTYFRTSVRQRQLKEQLLQSPLPSLLLNIFFVFSGGMFAALLLHHFGLGLQFPFWLLYLYCVAGLMAIYLVKFVLLKFMGWMLGAREATDTYIFVIYSTNKVLGIALLPVLLVLGFNQGLISQVAITLGLVLVLGLFVYRFFLSFVSIHRQVKVSFFHFLLYLAAFEVVPLLLINKLLFQFLR